MTIYIPIFSFGKGGGNRVLSNLANEWIKSCISVKFICFFESIEPYFPTSAEIIWISESGDITSRNTSNKHYSKLAKIWALKKAIEIYTKDDDVIIANEAFTAYPVYYAKTSSKKFYYIQADEANYISQNKGLKYSILSFLARKTYNLNITRIVNSPIYFNYNNIKSKYYVPPGLDYDLFYPKKNTYINSEQFIIGCIGRFEKQKGTIDVLKAFMLLIDEGYDAFLYVAFGNIDNLDSILLKYKDKIKLVFPKNDMELGEFYRSINVLVSLGTVQHYAHHYPVMEAMACGTPIITTGYIPATLANSWIVGPYSPVQTYKALTEIIDHKNKQVVEEKIRNGLNDIQCYQWQDVSNTFLKIILENR